MPSFQITTRLVLRPTVRLLDLILPLYTFARPVLRFQSSSESWSVIAHGSLDLINFLPFFLAAANPGAGLPLSVYEYEIYKRVERLDLLGYRRTGV